MHKLESIPTNETNKIFLDFERQTDHLTPARRSNIVLIKKKTGTCHLGDFSILANHRLK